jgi:undecaprenyl-diphosphatase
MAVVVAALVFGVLAALVRFSWTPLLSLDSAVARDLNAVVAPHPALVRALVVVTSLGGAGFLVRLVLLAVIVLAVRRRFRLAAYLTVTTLGALALDPTLKALIGRLRPVVPVPVAFGGGNSFPSGHALDSLICYGALVLVFLPAVSARGRRVLFALAGTVIVLIGASRVFLGVHFVSDVLGGWALGIAWLGLSVYAFELFRERVGRPVAQPLAEGIEPEAAPDVEPAAAAATPHARDVLSTAAWLVIGWVFLLAILAGLGRLIQHGPDDLLGDRSVPHWLAAHRTPALTSASAFWSDVGNTHAILAVGLVAGAVALGVIRSWRPVVFLVVLMIGELGLFLATAKITGRARPDVPPLDGRLPTSAFPSGHLAATICLYAGIALLVFGATRRWWRWVAVVPAAVVPLLVGAARLYRGMHHPTDLVGGVLLAAAWTTVAYLAFRPLGRVD